MTERNEPKSEAAEWMSAVALYYGLGLLIAVSGLILAVVCYVL